MNTRRFVPNAEQAEIGAEMPINGGVTRLGGIMISNGVVVDSHIHDKVKSGGDTSGGPQ